MGDEATRSELAAQLNRDGHEVVEVDDGLELLDFFAALDRRGKMNEPDVVLAELAMAGVSGLRVLLERRVLGDLTPFMLLTPTDESTPERVAARLATALVFTYPGDVDRVRGLLLGQGQLQPPVEANEGASPASEGQLLALKPRDSVTSGSAMTQPEQTQVAWEGLVKAFFERLLTDQRSSLSNHAVGREQLPSAAREAYEELKGLGGPAEALQVEVGGRTVFGIVALTDDGEQEGAQIVIFDVSGAELARGRGSADFSAGPSDDVLHFSWR